DAAAFLNGYALPPKGHAAAITSRGKLFAMALWEGAASPHGDADGVRHRLADWLHDGERIVCVTDETGEERLEVHAADLAKKPVVLDGLDVGHPYGITASPVADRVAVNNHRCELLLVDLAEKTATVIDRSPHGGISAGAWSPDGRWIAYSTPITPDTRGIRLYDTQNGHTHPVTTPVLADLAPAWDPDGKYLYFIGSRDLDPVYDSLHFDLNFPRGTRPYLVTLREDLPSPFVPVPHAPGEAPKDDKPDTDAKKKEKKDEAPKPVAIDLDGIAQRVVAFPVPLGNYGQVAGLPGGKVLFTCFPVQGTLGQHETDDDKPKGTLEMYDFAKQEKTTLASGMSDFALSLDGKALVYRAGKKLRALKAGEKPDEKTDKDGPSRKSGWLDLGRLKVSVLPQAEWRQMYREAWRLQRDHFWTEDMSAVDWERVYQRYLPVLERVGTRGEFSDLMWEMQGELGTSHAYEMGGDYRPHPNYGQGLLGADFAWEPRAKGYRVSRVLRGDSWNPAADSPLAAPGVNVQPGDLLVAIGGQPLTPELSPGKALVNQAGCEVLLTVKSGRKTRTACVKALKSEEPLRYRAWVEANRQRVHADTGGRVGYVHIPDMGARGYAEFHRMYLAEFDHDGLIVDVRCNGGGHVSQLILEKLARKRIGYDLPRWGSPEPYPAYSPPGPMVAVTDELAGSDGDIFS
ncbi:PDZ domain-containing protein, partial [bacterium]|nr:PDZ domain-containing protein [bacterium]